MNLKKIIAENLNVNESEILISPNAEMGDFCYPCFALAKIEKKSPNLIAEEIQKNLKSNKLIQRTEVKGAYVNFFLNKEIIAKEILKEVEKGDFFQNKDCRLDE